MRPLWTQPLHTSASIPLDYASKGYVDGVLAIPGVSMILVIPEQYIFWFGQDFFTWQTKR